MGPTHAPDGLVKGHVDVLAAAGEVAGAEGGEGAERGEDAGPVVGDEVAGADRGKVRVAGDASHAGEGEGNPIEAGAVAVGAGLAVAAYADDNEPAVGLAQGIGGEAPALEGAGAVVLDENVGGIAEPAEERAPSFPAEVEGDGLLAAVVLLEGDAVAVDLASAGRLDLNNLGAELGEEGGAEGGGKDLAGVDDAEAGEGEGRCVGHGDGGYYRR